MDYTVFENKLNELLKLINSTSSPKQEEVFTLIRQIKRFVKQLKKNTDRFQESSDMLRIVAKYQLFDLEATRRENSCLKKILEDSNWKKQITTSIDFLLKY